MGADGLYFYWGWGIGLNLSNTVQLITIISFTAGLVKYLIVQPLQVAITALELYGEYARLNEV